MGGGPSRVVDAWTATNLGNVGSIALDLQAGHIYWTEYLTSGGRISRCDLSGGNREVVCAGGNRGPYGMTLDVPASKIYWVESYIGKIMQADLSGANKLEVVGGLDAPNGIALAEGYPKLLYWTEANCIRRVDLGSGQVETLVTGLKLPYMLALDVLAGKMYWTNTKGTTIERATLSGGGRETVLSGLRGPIGIALDVDANKLYWSERDGNLIGRADMVVDGAKEVLVHGVFRPQSIALDLESNTLYYAYQHSDMINTDMKRIAIGARPAPAQRPRGLRFESVAQTEVALAWEQGSAISFEVQWRRASNPAWQTFATVRKSKARVSGLDAGAAYAFRVRAVGGEWSHEVSAQLSAPTPPADDSAVVAHLQLITGASAEAARAALVAHGNDANAAAAALLARWRPPAAKAATQKSRDLLPGYWNPSMNRLNATKFSVAPGSEEYTRVEKAFMLTLDDPARDLKRDQFTIQSVERIQKMDLWNLYVAKRKSICGRKSPKDAQSLVRNWLFHGCAGDVTAKIIQGGFNRSFAGRNATMYGKGVYFARDASYSTYPLYSQRDANDVQSIFLARVVVGEYCLGVQDAITPDVRDAATSALYDSTVDNVRDPSIFVTYNDGQAYPEYLVKFKQDGNPPSHPATGKPAHRHYRPNVFSDCYD